MFYCPEEVEKALKANRDAIIRDIAYATWDSHHDAFTKNGHRGDEIFTLYHFFLKALPFIEQSLRARLGPDFSVTVSGVVNHGTAYVRSTKPTPQSACELGDVIFLATYGSAFPDGGIGNAAIFQAKVSRDDICDPEQNFLYESATEFRYRDTKFGHSTRLLPNKKSPALLFWALQVSNAEEIAKARLFWRHGGGGGRVIHPLQLDEPESDLTFAEALFQLLAGCYGEGFGPPQAGKSAAGWDEIIDDAVTKISSNAIKNKLVSRSGLAGKRGQATPEVIREVIANKRSLAKTSIQEIFQRTGIKEWAALGAKLEDPKYYVSDEELQLLVRAADQPKTVKPTKSDGPPPITPLSWNNEDDGQGGGFVVIEIFEKFKQQLSLPLTQ